MNSYTDEFTFSCQQPSNIVEWVYKSLLESLIFSSRLMSNAGKILHDSLLLSRNNKHIMVYKKHIIHNDCVPISLKETEFSSHMLSCDAKKKS